MKKSLSLDNNQEMVFKAGQGAGKSGSFFFFSFDNKFLIKTITSSEKNILLDMLDDYINHIILTDNKSLLARIYGVFTIKSNYY
jgi:1-phosphatidylinositol-4-phosphate 5-kinase